MKRDKSAKIPKGWDRESLQEAANTIALMIEAYNNNPARLEKFERYQFAQDVFDDKKIPSNLVIVKDAEPKNYPLLRKQVKGVSRLVVSAMNGMDPYYVFSGDGDPDLKEAREKDTQIALEADKYKVKLRESARIAAISARSPYRIVWEERLSGEGWRNVAEVKDGDVEFAGPTKEYILAEDFGMFTLKARDLSEARCIWHRTNRPMFEIEEMRSRGEYFNEDIAPLAAVHDQDTDGVSEDNFEPNLYTGIVRLPTGMKKSEPLKAWRFTMHLDQRCMLYFKEYDLPMPEYFAPGFEYDPLDFWPTHSIASSIIPMVAELNDAQFTRLMSAVAAFKRSILVSGYAGEMTQQSAGMGEMMMFRGDPKFTVVQTTTPSDKDLAGLANDAKTYAEGVTGFSDVAAGQLPEASQSATATGGALQGTADEGEEKRHNFFDEEVRAIQFMQILIARNFKSFKRFHGDRLKTTSAKDWKVRYKIGPNGQGANNNPELIQKKIELFMQIIQTLGIPWLEDIQEGAAGVPNQGIAISKVGLLKFFQNNLDMPVSMENIIVDTSSIPTPAPAEQPDPALVAGPDALLGGIPPELLGMLGGGGALPIPAGLPPAPPPAALGGSAVDPMLAALIGAGIPAGV